MEKLPSTVEECHEVIRSLLKLVDTVDMLTKRVSQLESENQGLKERLAINSENSSLPPSQDIKKKKHTRNANRVASPVEVNQAIRVTTEHYCQWNQWIK